jgi:hypothetical protein
MHAASQATTSDIDWQQLYKDIEQRGNVPYASSETIASTQATFQAMYLDLAQIKAKITQSGLNPPLVNVYADVLNIPDETNWLLQNGTALFLVARRIQTGANVTVSLDYRSGNSATLVVFANEIEGGIRAVAVTQSEPRVFDISKAPAKGGVQIHARDGAPEESELDRARGLALQISKIVNQVFLREFIFASLLYDQRPEIALDQLIWLKDWTGESPDLLGIFFRSSSLAALLLSQINARANGAAFVPYLTQSVYTDLAAAFVAEAKQYEADYRALSTQKVITEQGIKLAKTLLDNQIYQREYVTKLLAQAKSNYDNAAAAVDSAKKNFDDAELNVKLVRADFEEIGVPDWRRAKIIEAVIELATGVITFGVGIAGMVATGGATGGAAAAEAVQTVKAVEQAAKTGSEIAKLAKQLKEVMEKLKTIIEALEKVYEFSKAIVAAAGKIDQAQKYADQMKKIDLDTKGVDLSAAFEWQIYQLNSDATLAGPVEQGIEFAMALKLAVDAVAIYGQALAAAQLAAVKAGQDYAAVQLQKELAERQEKRLREYVDSLKVDQAPIVEMMQEFYQRYVDAKSSLFAAIVGYRAAFFYWALDQSSIAPKVIDSVDQIDTGLRNLTAIALDRKNALERFDPPPQDLASARVSIEDPKVLEKFRKEGTAVWSVGLGVEAFRDLSRVRLRTVRMWLEGAQPGSSSQVSVNMYTAGNYLDRFQGTPYQFTSKPLQRLFRYRVSAKREPNFAWRFENGTYGYIEVDGKVDDEVRYAYFEPTPFGEWTIKVKTQDVDLSAVTKITMEFAGSVIPETKAKAAELAALAAHDSAAHGSAAHGSPS